METLPIWVTTIETEDRQTKSIFRPDAEAVLEFIPAEKLRANLSKVCNELTNVFDEVKEMGRFHLKQVEIQVEVSAEGGVQLIGTATIGGKGAITMTFGE